MNIAEFKNTFIGFKNQKETKLLLKDINISASEGELLALIGVNGSGKSTLLKTLAGLLPKLSGDIFLGKKKISEYSRKDLARKIAFVPSAFMGTKYLKVKDVVSLGRFPYHSFSSQNTEKDKEIIEKALFTVGMTKFKDRYLDEMSDGEKQKVMTARALAQDTDIILLDEPTSFLDLENKFALYKLFSETSQKLHKTIIFSTHDLNIALKYCDKVWLIKDQNIIEGSPEDLILSDKFKSVFSEKHIFFNDRTFEFSVKFMPKKSVFVEDNSQSELRKKILKNALNRNGFYISDGEDTEILIIIEPEGFKIFHRQNSYKMKSFYDLMKKLQELEN